MDETNRGLRTIANPKDGDKDQKPRAANQSNAFGTPFISRASVVEQYLMDVNDSKYRSARVATRLPQRERLECTNSHKPAVSEALITGLNRKRFA